MIRARLATAALGHSLTHACCSAPNRISVALMAVIRLPTTAETGSTQNASGCR